MSAVLIWINTHEAKLFHLRPNSIHVQTVKYTGPRHPVEVLGKNHPQHQTDERTFFRKLVKVLQKDLPSKMLLMGPGLGPKQFLRHLESHHDDLKHKVIGVEKVDQMPDSEILSIGRQFLQQYYLYNGTGV